ncbi:uncharacterized protein LOC122625474 isoform X6 [Drosophila teissieri]|uniref:uncharacterized protein LOC122625474 isoform X6 n=1 Tax=Drosophila teissieri TaxID=7243 RepID=UPI001CBA43AC|nr:uncharacterized protein LOC122625474 isoform X6 [Drosophila teissieri]
MKRLEERPEKALRGKQCNKVTCTIRVDHILRRKMMFCLKELPHPGNFVRVIAESGSDESMDR